MADADLDKLIIFCCKEKEGYGETATRSLSLLCEYKSISYNILYSSYNIAMSPAAKFACGFNLLTDLDKKIPFAQPYPKHFMGKISGMERFILSIVHYGKNCCYLLY